MIIIQLSSDQLDSIIQNAVRKVLDTAISNKNAEEKSQEIYGIKKAAKILELSTSAIYAKTSKGEIPHFKRGKRLYFRHSELIEWIEEGRKKTVKAETLEMQTYLNQKKKGGTYGH